MICGNCHIEMIKQTDPIAFGYNLRNRSYWKCTKCGARITRWPDANELDIKQHTFVYNAKDFAHLFQIGANLALTADKV